MFLLETLANVCKQVYAHLMARPKGHLINRDAYDDWTEKHLGKAITQIADESGIPRPTISGIVGGYQGASVPMAHKLAQAMGCRVGTIFPTLSASANAEVA